jgi:hypothetical protein
MRPTSPQSQDASTEPDPARICWTQWLRAHEGDVAAADTDSPVRPIPPPPITVGEIDRLFKDCESGV